MMVRVRGPLSPGMKVLRQAPAAPGHWPKQFRYYNPNGEPFEFETELTPWITLRIRDGEMEIVPEKPAKKGKEQ